MTPEPSWNWEPGLLLALAIYLGVYARRWARVRASAAPRSAPRWRLAAFVAAIGALFAALISPIDSLGEQMFTFHAVQHMLLMDVAPILAILGLTKVILRPLTARLQALERRAGPLAHPAFAVLLYAGTLWMWHIPALYELSLTRAPVHVLQHLQLVAAGGLFWWHLLSPIRSRHRRGGIGILYYVAGAKLLTGVLASMLTFSRGAWYPFFESRPRFAGWSVLRDQHFGGGVMMLEESIVLTVAFCVVFVRMLSESEEEERRRERYELGPG